MRPVPWIEFVLVVVPTLLFLLAMFPPVVMAVGLNQGWFGIAAIAINGLAWWGMSALWKMFGYMRSEKLSAQKLPRHGLLAGIIASLATVGSFAFWEVWRMVQTGTSSVNASAYLSLLALIPAAVGIRWFRHLRGIAHA